MIVYFLNISYKCVMKFQEIMNRIKQIDKKILSIVKNGVKFSVVFCLFAILILSTYISVGEFDAFYIGISLLKSGLFFVVGFIICGFAFNKIMHE